SGQVLGCVNSIDHAFYTEVIPHEQWTEEVPHDAYYDGHWGWGDVWNADEQTWESREGYWDVNGGYHVDYLPEEYHEAWTEYVDHPAWTEYVDHPAWTECLEEGMVPGTLYASGGIESGPSHGSLTNTYQGAGAFWY